MDERVGVQDEFEIEHVYKTAGKRPEPVSGGGLEPPRPIKGTSTSS
jgi:hypothetical protein